MIFEFFLIQKLKILYKILIIILELKLITVKVKDKANPETISV